MKSTLSIFATVLLTATSLSVLAQTEPVWRNDPTYSTHNYKHPNKAAAVQRRNMEPGVTVRFPQPGADRVANYKMPVIGQQPVGGVVLPHTPNMGLADRNYKMPRLSRPVVQLAPVPAIAEKPSSNSVTTE